jgi:hypothetical protein
MLPGRVYPLVVQFNEDPRAPGQRPGEAATVTAHPIIPGAQVMPAVAELSTAPGSSATFWVTPIVRRGRLPQARIEFRSQGKLLQTMPLRMKVARRWLTWLFVLLTIALPLGLAYLRANPSMWRAEITAYPDQKPPPGFEQGPPEGVPGAQPPAGGTVPPGRPVDDMSPGNKPKPPFKPRKPQTPPKDMGEPVSGHVYEGAGAAVSGVAEAERSAALGGMDELAADESEALPPPTEKATTKPPSQPEGQAPPGSDDDSKPSKGKTIIIKRDEDAVEYWVEQQGKQIPESIEDWDTATPFQWVIYQAKPVIVNGYHAFGVLRNMQRAELYAFLILVILTLIVWFVQKPARVRRCGPVVEIPV